MSSADSYDVMVIGGGGAGMSAALTASAAGARVCLLEAQDRLGGSTALAGGLFYAAGTRAQKALGIDDSAEAMCNYILAQEGDSVSPEVVTRLCHDAAPSLSWLESLGVDFPADRLGSLDGSFPPRSHEPVGFGAAIAQTLDTALSTTNVDIARKTRVQHLIMTPNGEVQGAWIDGERVGAKAVILACGGYGGDAGWVTRLLPKSQRVGDWLWHVGNPANRGDGLRMAEEAGAVVVGIDSGLLLSTPNFFRNFEVIGPDWVMMVNERGERFVREDGAYWQIAEALEQQEDSRAFCIFDHRLLKTAKPHPRVLEAYAQGAITLSWVTGVLEEQEKKGKVISAPDVAQLAAIIGIDPGALAHTLDSYNQACRDRADTQFGKSATSLLQITHPPFHAVEVRPAILVVTGGGVRIDEGARVLTAMGRPIPGLFAAGEIVGNVFGRSYIGSGYAIANGIVFGRIAGAAAAEFTACGSEMTRSA